MTSLGKAQAHTKIKCIFADITLNSMCFEYDKWTSQEAKEIPFIPVILMLAARHR